MGWPPRPGELLPRADACWYEAVKFEEWVLAPRGHGQEWRMIFGVGRSDRELVWQTLASAARSAPIVEVRDREPLGIVCGIREQVTIGERRAFVTMSWHYANSTAAPRLATAYPSP